MYIGDYLARRELYTPEKTGFVDYGKTPVWRLTFREANQRANRLANWLKAQGIQKGDRVAVLARDGYEH
ncbi:MAG: AMP-binding protein, partial [Anaerolineales bacterium]